MHYNYNHNPSCYYCCHSSCAMRDRDTRVQIMKIHDFVSGTPAHTDRCVLSAMASGDDPATSGAVSS